MIRWNSKVLLLKLEETYGVDANPTGAADAILAKNIRLNPMKGEKVQRELDKAHLGADPSILTGLHSVISFDVELAPSGTAGTAPAWGSLMRCCGMAETIVATTSVTYNPVTDGHESATVYLWIGTTLYSLTGTRGAVKFDTNAQGIPYLKFELTGLFNMPQEQVQPSAVTTSWKKPKVASAVNTPTYTIAGQALVANNLMLDVGNKIEKRFLFNLDEIIIADRSETVDAKVDAVPLTTFNPFLLARDGGTVAIQMVHGTTAGNIATLDIPAAEMQPIESLEESQKAKQWPLSMVPLPVNGNDQWTLTLT